MFEKIEWMAYSPRVKMGAIRQTGRKVCQMFGRFMYVNKLRVVFYRMMGMKIGKKVYIGFDCFLDSDFAELIEIEDGVKISFRVIIVAHDGYRKVVSRILIKKGVYVGAGAIILPGVTVGEKAVVCAGAVVMRDVPDGAVVIGNPAQPIMK